MKIENLEKTSSDAVAAVCSNWDNWDNWADKIPPRLGTIEIK